MQPPINFAALEKYESPKARDAWTKTFARKSPPGMKLKLRFFGYMFAALIFFGLVMQALGDYVIPIIIFAIVVVIYIAVRQNRKLKVAAAAFAADNGWQVVDQKPAFRIASITPTDPTVTVSTPGPMIAGKLDSCDFWSYQYRCTTRNNTLDAHGNTTTQNVTVEYHALTVALPAPLPVFFLDSQMDGNQEQQAGGFGASMQRLSLEGNFDSSFRLYQQPGSQIEVLGIITPEFMQALMDSGAFLNIESDGQHIHFISTYGTLLNCTPTRYLFEQSRQVLQRILFKLTTYQPASPAPQPTQGVSPL